jgi:dCMP deaminase
MSRPDWHDYFLRIAEVVALRSTCDRARVGCVITQDNRIISTGYNGAPSGKPHCDDVGHDMQNGHCVRTTHAEVSALSQVIVQEASPCISNAVVYCTHAPCADCYQWLMRWGVQHIYYRREYGNVAYFRECVTHMPM